MLAQLAPALAADDNCVRLDVVVEDGRAAATRVADFEADVWIPDDIAWGSISSVELAEESDGGPGTVVALSPIYMVADDAAADRLTDAGRSWRALADLATADPGIRLRVRDPAGSGDGLIGVGAVGEAVWLDDGMDASAEALFNALPVTRTVLGQPVPQAGEVGLIAEYALIRLLAGSGEDAARVKAASVFAGTDHSAVLRYTWLPTAAAMDDPALARPLERVLSALTGGEADEALAAAGLRRPDGGPPPGAPDDLPELSAPAFDVLGEHNIDHVFATWYVAERRADMLVVIDVSGSMGEPAPGSTQPLINVVRTGTRELAKLLPDDSELAIWEFGSRLSPPRDYRTLLPRNRLDQDHRRQLMRATRGLAAEDTGTGLYDTILAAYRTARDGYQSGIPSHVVLFTDGRNADDPGSLSASGLKRELEKAMDPDRPVIFTIVTFGPEPDAELLGEILEPVDGYVDPVRTTADVRSVFIHVAAGGVHH
ncbi:MAG: VWA domain-containing protein [Sporichthyaceae bacterium]|nr:VWA domain-containing protein [Sporichthyaceae bacterium]